MHGNYSPSGAAEFSFEPLTGFERQLEKVTCWILISDIIYVQITCNGRGFNFHFCCEKNAITPAYTFVGSRLGSVILVEVSVCVLYCRNKAWLGPGHAECSLHIMKKRSVEYYLFSYK